MNGPATAATMSPAIPLPPMPRTTTELTSSIDGSPSSPFARSAAAATCSGRASVAAEIPCESLACAPPTADPPAARLEAQADGPTVEAVLLPGGEGGRHLLAHRLLVVDRGVDLAGRRVALELLPQLVERTVGLGHDLQHQHGGDQP